MTSSSSNIHVAVTALLVVFVFVDYVTRTSRQRAQNTPSLSLNSAHSAHLPHPETHLVTPITVLPQQLVQPQPPAPPRKLPSAKVVRKFVRYEPSTFEQEWVDHIAEWQSDDPNWGVGCSHLRPRSGWIDTWLRGIAQRRANVSNVDMDRNVFSRLVYTLERLADEYGNRRNVTEVVRYIEPLVSHLRHPHHVCWSENFLFDKSWLVLPKAEELNRKGRNFFFDLGASTYDKGAGGPSQQWFLDEYAQHGIIFDRYLAWEGTPIPPTSLWGVTPFKMKTILSYYNILSSSDPNSDDNVVRFMLALCRPDDYCAIKIDIDNNPIETAIINQILNTPALHPLIDDLFWEHHVPRHPMVSRGWGSGHDLVGSPADSYRLFTALRKVGIRAHSWV